MHHKLLLLCLPVAFVTVVLISCKKDSANHTPVASISDTSRTVNENAGTVSITVNLSEAPSQALKLDFKLTGTAILNGDFEPDSSSYITVAAGSKTATLKFTIYDDPVAESDKTIHVKFSSAGNVSFANSDVTVTIKDNDASQAANGLQVDLFWDAGSPVDLDLYAVNNVVIVNNEVTDFDLVDSSESAKGFESVLVSNNNTDGPYYIVVFYAEGSRVVNFTLNANAPNISNATTADSFPATDLGVAYFFGPITKTGSSYGRQSRGIFNLPQLKSYIYHGKIK